MYRGKLVTFRQNERASQCFTRCVKRELAALNLGERERAAIELSKDWRTDKYLRHLEALIIVADKTNAFLISGKGDVISSDEGLLSVGSGSMYALSAARALLKHTALSAPEIAEESLRIAADICIYTNSEIVVEEL